MPINFMTLKRIRFVDIFDGRLEQHGVLEHRYAGTTDKERCLTDGENYLWLYAEEDGLLAEITQHEFNDPTKILGAIAMTFDARITSEFNLYFHTKEEWDAYEEEVDKEYQELWYPELCKYLRGEPNNIEFGTSEETEALIARELVDQSPELMLPENRDTLLARIDEIYDQRREDEAFAEELATDEDDLPQA